MPIQALRVDKSSNLCSSNENKCKSILTVSMRGSV